jgi:hypothetical protein
MNRAVPAQALIIDEPWIGHIMAGRKTWEMRSRRTTRRGPVALVRKGSGQIVAVATVADCLPPLSPTQMAASFQKHRIPQAMIETASYKWFTPWVLSDVRVLQQPVSYRHPSGAVTWVDLAPDVQALLVVAKTRPVMICLPAAAGRGVEPVQPNRPGAVVRSARSAAGSVMRRGATEADGLAVAKLVLDDLRTRPNKVDVPEGASVSVTQRGNKLHIDAVWEDGTLTSVGPPTQWRELIGTFSALGAMLCMATLLIMVVVGLATWSMTFFHAFYAVPPMFVLMLIATLTGHTHLLPEFNEGHDRKGNPR